MIFGALGDKFGRAADAHGHHWDLLGFYRLEFFQPILVRFYRLPISNRAGRRRRIWPGGGR